MRADDSRGECFEKCVALLISSAEIEAIVSSRYDPLRCSTQWQVNSSNADDRHLDSDATATSIAISQSAAETLVIIERIDLRPGNLFADT